MTRIDVNRKAEKIVCVSELAHRVYNKLQKWICLGKFLLGDDTPAREFLQIFKNTSTNLPVDGKLGELRGHGSQTVVADFDLKEHFCDNSKWGDGTLVLKFEIFPGEISKQRLSDEFHNEIIARAYLNRFMPPTLRLIGHGMRNEPSALIFQLRIEGKTLRHTTMSTIKRNPELMRELASFCDAVLKMSEDLGQIPDLAGTLPKVDHLSNIFRLSRNIVIDHKSSKVWLVDTGWKRGQESLTSDSFRIRIRTWFRLQSMRIFQAHIKRARRQ